MAYRPYPEAVVLEVAVHLSLGEEVLEVAVHLSPEAVVLEAVVLEIVMCHDSLARDQVHRSPPFFLTCCGPAASVLT